MNPNDNSNLKLTLFQYEPCPFCQKVRAFLDFSGLSYDIVEVHPVTKKELGWSPYKKVPIVILQIKEGYQVLPSIRSKELKLTSMNLINLLLFSN